MLTFRDLAQGPPRNPDERFMFLQSFSVIRGSFKGLSVGHIVQRLNGRLVVWPISLRFVCGKTVTLEIDNFHFGRINRQLLIIYAQTVAMGVWVREQARL